MEHYDVIVIGLGAMGGAAALHCAERGARVLGLDANPPRHVLGSSHGATRAIRETYFESPHYVPLVQRSFELWRDLEARTGRALLSTAGAVYVAPGGHPLLAGVERAAAEHDLAIDRMDRAALTARFPGFAAPEGWAGIFEERGGVLRAADCLDAHAALARQHGADLRFGCAAHSWRQTAAGSVIVETGDGAIEAGAVILTLGPWACDGLGELGLPLSGRRITIAHFETGRPLLYDAAKMSVYIWATPEGVYAGFPHFDGEGAKIMRHDTGDVCTPETVRRAVTDDDLADVIGFADKYMPHVNAGVREALVGLYTMTPDNHFIIDRHPGFDNLAYATGFCGHGFKFAPVVGEVLADLALDGRTAHPVGFLGAGRFAERQPPAAHGYAARLMNIAFGNMRDRNVAEWVGKPIGVEIAKRMIKFSPRPGLEPGPRWSARSGSSPRLGPAPDNDPGAGTALHFDFRLFARRAARPPAPRASPHGGAER